MAKMPVESKRVSINIPVETANRIDVYAQKMGITRTSAILVLCNQALDSMAAVSEMSKLSDLLNQVGKD